MGLFKTTSFIKHSISLSIGNGVAPLALAPLGDSVPKVFPLGIAYPLISRRKPYGLISAPCLWQGVPPAPYPKDTYSFPEPRILWPQAGGTPPGAKGYEPRNKCLPKAGGRVGDSVPPAPQYWLRRKPCGLGQCLPLAGGRVGDSVPPKPMPPVFSANAFAMQMGQGPWEQPKSPWKTSSIGPRAISDAPSALGLGLWPSSVHFPSGPQAGGYGYGVGATPLPYTPYDCPNAPTPLLKNDVLLKGDLFKFNPQNNDYLLDNFNRSNQDTCLLHKPSVHEGQWVQSGDLLADCASSVGGELALGQNLLIAYMPWEGYNYEDAILISERLVYDDLYTSVHIEKYETETRETKLGMEEITREIPEISQNEIKHLDKHGIAKVGSWVEEGDILVGKTTPVSKKDLSSYQKLLYTILEKEYLPVRDSSLRAPKGIRAKIIKIQVFSNNPLKQLHPKPKKKLSPKGLPLLKGLKTNLLTRLVLKPNMIGLGLWPNYSSPKNTQRLGPLNLLPFGQSYQLTIIKKLYSGSPSPLGARRANGGLVPPRLGLGLGLGDSVSLPPYPKYGVDSISPKGLLLRPNHALALPMPAWGPRDTERRYWPSPQGLGKFLESPLSPQGLGKFPESPLSPQGLGKLGVSPRDKGLLESPLSPAPKGVLHSHRYGVPQWSKGLVKLGVSPKPAGLTPRVGLGLWPSSVPPAPQYWRSQCLPKPAGLSPKAGGRVPPKGLLESPLPPSLKKSKLKPLGLGPGGPSKPCRLYLYLAEKRKVQVGDKLAGRHGNKGIISMILPREDMPYLPDGTPIDMVLNPLGVPSRMNVGQIYECLLGLAGKYLGENYKVFPFDEIYGPEASRSFVYSKLNEARLKTGLSWLFEPSTPGKMRLYDGRTGDCFDQAITVGIAYILRLVHMVDDKIHARSTGPYSLVTQQPLRGRSKQGGQRLGEMEVWAIEGYGAAFTLLEMLTIKSDDMTGRMTLWSNLILNKDISIGTPESFKVLICELQALCLDIGLFRSSKSIMTSPPSPYGAVPSRLSQEMLALVPPGQENKVNSQDYGGSQGLWPNLIEIENLMNLP